MFLYAYMFYIDISIYIYVFVTHRPATITERGNKRPPFPDPCPFEYIYIYQANKYRLFLGSSTFLYSIRLYGLIQEHYIYIYIYILLEYYLELWSQPGCIYIRKNKYIYIYSDMSIHQMPCNWPSLRRLETEEHAGHNPTADFSQPRPRYEAMQNPGNKVILHLEHLQL